MTLTYVVAYARFSSDNQREESIDAQLRAIRQYCQQHDYILLDTYIDEARSATTDDRPAFQQMIKDSASGDWSAVMVTNSTASHATDTTAQSTKNNLKTTASTSNPYWND